MGSAGLTVANDANVEFSSAYGTLAVSEGKVKAVTCSAKRARPLGEFKWRIGEESDGDAILVNAGLDKVKVSEEDDEGHFTAKQVSSQIEVTKTELSLIRCSIIMASPSITTGDFSAFTNSEIKTEICSSATKITSC